MKRQTFLLSFFLILLTFIVLAIEPPSLENHQFYGYVFWNEDETAPEVVLAYLEEDYFSSLITPLNCANLVCIGKYGYGSDNILRVEGGKEWDLIFFEVDAVTVN